MLHKARNIRQVNFRCLMTYEELKYELAEVSKHCAMETYCGNGGIAPRILNVGARWR
jgi:hypothetical protein